MSVRRRIVISFFICLNVLTALIVPIKPRVRQSAIENFLYPYALWSRILQEWSLFTPNPRKNFTYYKFVIHFKDGSKKTWVRPYGENWNFFQRHLAYNWQKLDLAGHNFDTPVLYSDLADFIKRKFWDAKNPPKTVGLFRVEARWPDPKPTGYVFPDQRDLHWFDTSLFSYSVEQDKFL